MKKVENNIKLIDLWYVDGNYNQPVKTKGFKSMVQANKSYKEEEGFVFINPNTKAFTVTRNKETIFETQQDAENCVNKQIKSHIEFAKRQVKEYTEDLKKYGAI